MTRLDVAITMLQALSNLGQKKDGETGWIKSKHVYQSNRPFKKKKKNQLLSSAFPPCLPTSTLGWLMSDRVTGYASLTLSPSHPSGFVFFPLSLSFSPLFQLSAAFSFYPAVSLSLWFPLWTFNILPLSCLPPLGWSTGLDLIPQSSMRRSS